ncbi:MAG: hypothetical protein KTR14_10715 [Vampirovibrio sp.]|nr:hypothetical protein [Vampirovibrio sp.]
MSRYDNKLQDIHLIPVLHHLDQMEESYTFYAYSSFPSESSVIVSFNNSSEKKILIRTHNADIDLTKIKTIWNRTPGIPKAPENTSNLFKNYIELESSSFLKSLPLLTPQVKWLPDPIHQEIANYKPYQLDIAVSVGLSIPHTLIGNDRKSAIKFLEDHSFVILKGQQKGTATSELPVLQKLFQWVKNKITDSNSEKINVTVVPSQKFCSTNLLENIHHLQACPVNLQSYIPKQFELRITIVHKQVFACAIYTQGSDVPEAHVDFRKYVDYLHHEAYTLPADIEEKCLLLMEKLRLDFGCIDMIVTPENEYVFLEINPNGQWLWIEEKTGLPIAKAIADYLANPPIST